jgi:hypothetical protein
MTDVGIPMTGAVITAEVAEVTATGTGRAVPPVKKAPPRQVPKWESETRDRVRAAVRRFAKPLADLIARDANEGDNPAAGHRLSVRGPGL